MKCNCKSSPEYHRDDCQIYDPYGKLKNNKTLLNSWGEDHPWKSLYNEIIKGKLMVGDLHEAYSAAKHLMFNNRPNENELQTIKYAKQSAIITLNDDSEKINPSNCPMGVRSILSLNDSNDGYPLKTQIIRKQMDFKFIFTINLQKEDIESVQNVFNDLKINIEIYEIKTIK